MVQKSLKKNALSVLHEYKTVQHIHFLVSADFAAHHQVPFYTLSAVTSGVEEVRDVLERCKQDAQSVFSKGRPILFIDEIHRFNKSQQDSLLGAVENGTVTLIGATTENPSFEVIRPLLSRAQVYVLNPLDGGRVPAAHRPVRPQVP